jgi:peptidoglycan hydrolase-like protein with peptidoglycan-binding domain
MVARSTLTWSGKALSTEIMRGISCKLMLGREGVANLNTGVGLHTRDDDETASAHARQAEQDAAAAPNLPRDAAPPPGYSLDVEIVLRKLDRLGYNDVGDLDGKWGGKTKGAITAFLNDRNVQAAPSINPTVTDAISSALAEGWTRPIADRRANATAEDIAPKVEAVRQSLWQRLAAKITGASAGGVAVVSGVGSQFGAVNDHLSPIKQFFADVPGWAWFALIAVGALALWLSANRATLATTADYNTGKIN